MIPHDDIFRALEYASGVAVITDRQGVIYYATPSIQQLTGYSAEELYQQHSRIFKSELNPPTLYDDMWETILSKKEWSGVLRNTKKDGSTYLERLRILPLTGDDGSIKWFIGMKEDAGEHMVENPESLSPEEERLAVVRTESVLETIMNLASEFQSSLQMVMGFSQILNDDLASTVTGSQYEYFDIVIRTIRRLLRTLDDTVLLARLESDVVAFDPMRINVAEELRQIVAKVFPLGDSQQVRFIKVIEDTGAEILMDRESFGTIVTHLLINAMKFTKEGSITIGLQNQNNQAVIWVIDTGVGISEQFKPRLFQSFKQEELGFHKEFEGAGLGLAITNNLVSKLGGTLTFESYKGSGSTFIVSFPIVGWEDKMPSPSNSTKE